MGTENPAPATGEGDDAGASWAETAAEKIAKAKTSNKALGKLTWAISEMSEGVGENVELV